MVDQTPQFNDPLEQDEATPMSRIERMITEKLAGLKI